MAIKTPAGWRLVEEHVYIFFRDAIISFFFFFNQADIAWTGQHNNKYKSSISVSVI